MSACVAPESSPETPTLGRLVRQPNGGYLRQGNPGQRKGGRTPDYIRRLARRPMPEGIKILSQIMRGVSVQFEDTESGQRIAIANVADQTRVAAIKALNDIGMGSAVTMSDIRERLQQQAQIMRQVLKPEDAEALFKALKGVWR